MANDSTKTTIDSAYFHTGNGGLNLSVVQTKYTYSEGKESVSYKLKASFSHMGVQIGTEFPLGSLEIVGWLADVFARLTARMGQDPNLGRHSGFDYEKTGSYSVRNGKEDEHSFRWIPGKGLINVDRTLVSESGPGFSSFGPKYSMQDGSPVPGDKDPIWEPKKLQ